MKRIQYICLLCCILCIMACDSILEKNPYDQLSPATFWKTESDALKGLIACYGRLTTSTFGCSGTAGSFIFWDALTDNMFANNYMGMPNIANGIIQSTSGGLIAAVWNDSYKGINTVNIYLKNVESCQMNEKIKEMYKAEAMFLRAFWYFHLVMCYGDVPLRIEAPTVDDILMPRTSKNEIWKQIITDLDFAINHLPDQSYTGHVVRGSALGLKAKVLLFNEKWDDAATAAKEIIDSGIFSLYPDYLGNFIRDGQVDSNKELMFTVKYLAPDLWHGLDLVYGNWGVCAPIQDAIDFYEKLGGWSQDSPYENRDPRMRMSIFYPGSPWAYDKVNGFNYRKMNNNQTGYGLKKYVHTEVDNAGYTTESDQDIVQLRYADILLIYAEAMYQAGKADDPSVLKAINDIRNRVGLYAVSAVTEDIIRYERRAELAFEGHRYYDLKRWKIADKIIPLVKNPNGNYKDFQQKHYLWPVPQDEMDINTELVQTSGY